MLMSEPNSKQLSLKKTIFTLLPRDQRLKNAPASVPWSHVCAQWHWNHPGSSGLEKKNSMFSSFVQEGHVCLLSCPHVLNKTRCYTECSDVYGTSVFAQ